MLQSRECKTDQGHERGYHRAMNAPLKTLEGSGGRPSGTKGASDLPALMRQIGRDARTAARVLALAPAAQKNRALAAMAKAIRAGHVELVQRFGPPTLDDADLGPAKVYLQIIRRRRNEALALREVARC